MFKKLRISEKKNQALLDACKHNDIDKVKTLTNQKNLTYADINFDDGHALLIAAKYGYEELYHWIDARCAYVDDSLLLSVLIKGPSLTLLDHYLSHFVDSENPDKYYIIRHHVETCHDIEKLKFFLKYSWSEEDNYVIKCRIFDTGVRKKDTNVINFILDYLKESSIHMLLAREKHNISRRLIEPFCTEKYLPIAYEVGFDIDWALHHEADNYMLPLIHYLLKKDPVVGLEAISKIDFLYPHIASQCLSTDSSVEETNLYI